MTELPATLRDALSRPGRATPTRRAEGPVSRGDLRFARPTEGPGPGARLVLVTAVHAAGGYVEVALVHPYPEMACGLDAVVDGDGAGVPYRVVVETDLLGVLWAHQLGAAVGRLRPAVMHELRRVIAERDAEDRPGVRCGLRLGGPVDPRWRFKYDEGEDLTALAGPCTATLLFGSPPPRP